MNNGKSIPQIGQGLWKVLPGFVCKRAVKEGLEAGYRHFDSAQYYLNEKALGTAIKESGIDRSELFITTKIKNDNFAADLLAPSFDKSLEKLQMDYVDLLLLHFPVSGLRQGAWPIMEKIYKTGKARSIGVSNYTLRHLEELLKDCEVVPAVNQVELHVFLQQPELVEYCKKHKILIEAYSPLAHGKAMNEPVLSSIAKKYGKTNAQIMIRWCIEIGTVPLPKSTHKNRIKENFEVFDFKLDTNDMAKLKKLDRGLRTCWDPTNVA
jgi:diketogulonate reductase-like aldo/keto reductase